MGTLDLSDRTVLVCGAGSSGAELSNGEAVALTDVRARGRVAVLDKNPDEAERVTEKIASAGGTALPVRAEVTSAEDVEGAVARVRREFGTERPAQQRRRSAASTVCQVQSLGTPRRIESGCTNVIRIVETTELC